MNHAGFILIVVVSLTLAYLKAKADYELWKYLTEKDEDPE